MARREGPAVTASAARDSRTWVRGVPVTRRAQRAISGRGERVPRSGTAARGASRAHAASPGLSQRLNEPLHFRALWRPAGRRCSSVSASFNASPRLPCLASARARLNRAWCRSGSIWSAAPRNSTAFVMSPPSSANAPRLASTTGLPGSMRLASISARAASAGRPVDAKHRARPRWTSAVGIDAASAARKCVSASRRSPLSTSAYPSRICAWPLRGSSETMASRAARKAAPSSSPGTTCAIRAASSRRSFGSGRLPDAPAGLDAT